MTPERRNELQELIAGAICRWEDRTAADVASRPNGKRFVDCETTKTPHLWLFDRSGLERDLTAAVTLFFEGGNANK